MIEKDEFKVSHVGGRSAENAECSEQVDEQGGEGDDVLGDFVRIVDRNLTAA